LTNKGHQLPVVSSNTALGQCWIFFLLRLELFSFIKLSFFSKLDIISLRSGEIETAGWLVEQNSIQCEIEGNFPTILAALKCLFAIRMNIKFCSLQIYKKFPYVFYLFKERF
jgi:hypothetical protein